MSGPNPTDPKAIPSHLVIPFLAMTADKCRVLAERGEEIVPLLGQGKSGRMLKSRFMAAIKRLREIADRGSYSQTKADLQADVRAITTSSDFYQIAGVMPHEMPAHIVRDLFKALNGDVGSRVPDKFLSQYWFGLILARRCFAWGAPRKTGEGNPRFPSKRRHAGLRS